MSDDKAEILHRLNDGRTVPTYPCNCGRCGNEWFVPGYSEEWMPSFCPYCGLKFIRRTVGAGEEEEAADFKPRSPSKPAVGPATKHIMDMLRLAAGGRDERLSVTIDCGGYEEYLGIDVINAANAELEADA